MHNPDKVPHINSKMPCLMTKSLMVLMKSAKMGLEPHMEPLTLAPNEYLETMGWPMYAGQSHCLSAALDEVSSDFMIHVAGNGMHIMVAGVMLLYALACTARVKDIE